LRKIPTLFSLAGETKDTFLLNC